MLSAPVNWVFGGNFPVVYLVSEFAIKEGKLMEPALCPFADIAKEVVVKDADAALTSILTGIEVSRFGKLNKNSCS
ncbi:hypothetical protein D3C80_803450 [compost metagenome]